MSKLGTRPLKKALAGHALSLIAGQKDHAHCVLPGGRKLQADVRGYTAQKSIGKLEQNPCPIPSILFRSTSPAMAQILQDPNAVADNLVRLLASHINHKTHATSFMLVGWVVQSLPLGGLLPSVAGLRHIFPIHP
jgi:hypothetical protein